MGNGKAKSLVEYLDNLVEKGKATPAAINPLKIAFTKVMQVVDGENWENIDVNSIDVDDYMSRFANLTMGKYTTQSLAAYKSRIGRAITWYLQFIDKPGWAPIIGRRERTSKKTGVVKDQSQAKNRTETLANKVNSQDLSQSEITNVDGRILYPYPLTDGQLVHISLPIKLSKVDARRIGAFIESIAIDDGDGHE